MSSPGWETVGNAGKAIKKTGSDRSYAKKEAEAKKKFVEKAPKLEDILSYSDVASIYSVVGDVPSANGGGGGKAKQPAAAANSKKPPAQPEKKAEKANKEEGKPRTIEEAAKKIIAPKLKNLLTATRTSYPDDGLLWIRDAASYLNLTLVTVNTELSSSDFQHFSQKPLSLLNKETKKILHQLLDECGESARAAAFETLLANLSHDMARNHCVQGYLIILQMLADMSPTLSYSSSSRFSDLKNSYQNRANIGTALLWAVGLGGKKDLQTGLKVWLEYMVPLLPFRHYTRFVVDYLKSLLKLHNVESMGKVAKNKDGSRLMYPTQFFLFFDAFFITSQTLNKEILPELMSQYKYIKKICIGDCDQDHELFPELLRRLSTVLSAATAQPAHEAELLTCLEECLVGNMSRAAITHWRQMYRSHFVPSARLLQHLDSKWDKSVSKKLSRDSSLEDLIDAFQDYNVTCSQQKEGVQLATASAESLLKKMSRRNSSGGWFPWKTSSVVLIFLIGYLVRFDIEKHGGFQASSTGRFLQDVGLYNQTVAVYSQTVILTSDIRAWSETNVPIYAAKARQTLGPWYDKAAEGVQSGVAFVQAKAPIVTDKINEYLPGIKEKMVLFGEEVYRRGEVAVIWTREHGLEYAQWTAVQIKDLALCGLEHLKDFGLALVQCCKDIFDGKIDLKDVKDAVIRSSESFLRYVDSLYKVALKQIQS